MGPEGAMMEMFVRGQRPEMIFGQIVQIVQIYLFIGKEKAAPSMMRQSHGNAHCAEAGFCIKTRFSETSSATRPSKAAVGRKRAGHAGKPRQPP